MPAIKRADVEFIGLNENYKIIDPQDIEIDNDEETRNVWQNMYLSSRPYLQTLLEGGAAVAGTVIGTAAGRPATGDALGYAVGAEALDALDVSFGIKPAGTVGEELTEAGRNIMSGYTQHMGGRLIGEGVIGGAKTVGRGVGRLSDLVKRGVQKYRTSRTSVPDVPDVSLMAKPNKTSKFPPITEQTIAGAAGRELAETRPRSELAMYNWSEADILEETIPNLKFTRGQKLGTPDAMLLEDALIRSGVKLETAKAVLTGKALSHNQHAEAQKAIHSYFKNTTDKGTINTFIDTVLQKQSALETASTVAEKQARTSIQALDTTADEYTLSRSMLGEVKGQKKAAVQAATELYDKVPNIPIETTGLKKSIADFIEAEESMLEPRTLKIVNSLIEHIKDPMVSFTTLRKMRTRINRNMKATASNAEDLRQLKQVKDAIKDTIETGFTADFKFSTNMAKANKIVNQKTVVQMVRNNVIKDTDWYRGTNIDELDHIINKGTIPVGTSYEGQAGISAYTTKKNTTAPMQGSYESLPVVILGDKSVVEGAGQGLNEVLIKPATDPKLLKYMIGGKVYDYNAMTKVVSNYKHLANVGEEAGPAYKKASTFYRDYSQRFKEGTIADILKPGARGEETKIPMSKIGKRILSKDGVIDYIRAVGKNKKAITALDKYVDKVFHKAAYSDVTDKLKPAVAFNWINKNAEVLDRLGTKQKYYDLAKKMQKQQTSVAEVQKFGQSTGLPGKILQTDAENFIKNTFGTSKDYAKTATELRDMVKGKPKAIQGLQKAMADHIMNSSKVTAEGFVDDFKISYPRLDTQVKKYMPALRVLYGNAPKKLNALMNVHKAFRVLNRDVSSLVNKQPSAFDMFSVLARLGSAGSLKFPVAFTLKKLGQKYSDTQIKKVLLRATFDPEYAMGLEYMLKPKNAKYTKEVIKKFDGLMSRLTAYSAARLTEKSS